MAATDTYALYNPEMDSIYYGCQITQNGTSGSYTYSVAGDYADRPVCFVSWGDAARFANWLHNNQATGPQGLSTTEDGAYFLNGATSDAALLAVSREPDWKWAMTSEDEWYKAAYYDPDKPGGPGYWDYPTGTDDPDVPSNDLVDPDPGNNANFYMGPDDYTIGSPYYTTEVGEFENSESPYGTFDQGGNVFEWNEALLAGLRGLRGGSFYHYVFTLHAACADRVGPSPSYEGYVGFRVSEVPEPASAALLLLGLPWVLHRRHRR